MSAPPETLLTDRERVRRLLALPGVRPGLAERLAASRVAMVGMGGLGNPVALYLAAQGVGALTLIDPDQVQAHNLGRQILFAPSDVGQSKVNAAQRALRRTAPNCTIVTHETALRAENISDLLEGSDLVIDGLDRAAPRMILNRWAVASAIPVLFGGAIGYEAQVFGVRGGKPCLYCLFGELQGADEDCVVAGVLGPVVGLAAMVQASEALKMLLGTGQSMVGRMWTYDAFSLKTRMVSVPPRRDCPVCGDGR
ncbi:MAG: HesA/MoeB/ThiF family protein [Thermaerobacter sp.]|nr:HesA/MoeB/ThiF family protein [Thermaerobacter sp.]